MKLNVADWERIVRVLLGLAGVGIALAGISPWGWAGLIFVVTGVVGYCPIWHACKIDTRKKA
jgi:uncharacterized membrane protein YuzA (DUF378 family)